MSVRSNDEPNGLVGIGCAGLAGSVLEAGAPPAPVMDQESTPAAVVPPPPAPTYDSAKVAEMATGMLVMIDDAPQCQAFRDQLQALANAPADAPPSVAPSAIVAQANAAGCAKKYGK